MVLICIRAILSVHIWALTICKDYQQMTKVAANMQIFKYFDKHIVIIDMNQLQIRKYWNVKTQILDFFVVI